MIPADSTIRRALLADAGAIADVHVETWRNTYAGILPDSYLVDMSPKNHASLWTRLLRREPAERNSSSSPTMRPPASSDSSAPATRARPVCRGVRPMTPRSTRST